MLTPAPPSAYGSPHTPPQANKLLPQLRKPAEEDAAPAAANPAATALTSTSTATAGSEGAAAGGAATQPSGNSSSDSGGGGCGFTDEEGLALCIGRFLRVCPGLNKTTIGELLGEPDQFYLKVRG